jgi:hypothetical protein
MSDDEIEYDYDQGDYDEHLCDYCGDNYTSSTYCSGWCKYRAEVRAPMKRETMRNIIQNLPAFEEKRKLEAEAENKPYVPLMNIIKSEEKKSEEAEPEKKSEDTKK